MRGKDLELVRWALSEPAELAAMREAATRMSDGLSRLCDAVENAEDRGYRLGIDVAALRKMEGHVLDLVKGLNDIFGMLS